MSQIKLSLLFIILKSVSLSMADLVKIPAEVWNLGTEILFKIVFILCVFHIMHLHTIHFLYPPYPPSALASSPAHPKKNLREEKEKEKSIRRGSCSMTE